jgi:ATP-dependent exoDNAse (exonuclease V) beta subunit
MDFTPAQHDAIFLDGNLVVTAGAGSGKTRVLIERYLRLLTAMVQSGQADASAILAITFTDKAAREMRDRVRTEVEKQARAAQPARRPLWEELRTSVESARIGTIHSFCTALLRAQPAEALLDPRFNVLDETLAFLLLKESIDQALGQGFKQNLAVFEEYSSHEVRAMLFAMVQGGAEVRAAIEGLPSSPNELISAWEERFARLRLLVLNDIITAVPWCSASATLQSLAATAPANDLIGAQVAQVAAALENLSPPPGEDGSKDKDGSTGRDGLSPSAQEALAAIAAINLKGGSKKAWGSAEKLQAAKAALTTLRESCAAHKTLLQLVPDAELEQRAARAVLDLGSLYRLAAEIYTRRKEEQNSLDFDDLLSRARALLADHPEVRARWWAEFQAVLVDEFQDTDNDQRAIIYALTGLDSKDSLDSKDTTTKDIPPIPTLFVVGDAKQSIYRFRGADVSVFRDVQTDLAAKGGREVNLDTSFRTHPPLLNWINQITGAIFAREGDVQPYEVLFEPLRAHRDPPSYGRCVELHIVAAEQAEQEDNEKTPAPAGGEKARKTVGEQRTTEARILAERINTLVAGTAGKLVYDGASKEWRVPCYGDIALLFRAATVFTHYEEALRNAGIPYLTAAGRGYYGRKEVQDLIHLLYVLNDPTDELALVGVLRSPLFALDDSTIVRLRLASTPPTHPRAALHYGLWNALMNSEENGTPAGERGERLRFARDTLRNLYARRGQHTVVELLREALAATGYMATISGLQDGERRRANVEKLLETARRAGNAGLNLFSLYLDNLLRAEPREGEAPLEAEGSVRLMSIHRSKGLEFPVVVLPDLGRSAPSRTELWMARRAYGVALRLRDERGDWQNPLAYHLAASEEQRMEKAERERLLYVALTRARDYLILGGPPARKSGTDWLSSLLAAAGHPWETGGPPVGQDGVLEVWRYNVEE